MFCEITVKIVQGLPRTTFYSENKIFLLTHFQEERPQGQIE